MKRQEMLGSRRRRQMMLATAGLSMGASRVTHAAPPRRVVVLNWELTEMLLSLGVTPVGIAAPAWYVSSVVEPPLPAGVIDVGLLYQPNYELLFELALDLMIITPAHANVKASFERISPTLTLGMYMTKPNPIDSIRGETMQLGRRLQREDIAARLIADTYRTIADARASLDASTPAGGYPEVYVAQYVDNRRLRVYGAGSMFDEVLGQLGIRNAAATLGVNRSGFAIVSLERLASRPDAHILWVSDNAPEQLAALARNRIWQALPFSRDGHTHALPVISANGALISVQRFARGVANTLGLRHA